jgi:hypothetical protein
MRTDRRSAASILLVVVVGAAALGARWSCDHAAAGSRFIPRPDALEYAAAAQAIAQSFRYYLQVGPYQVRPRYPPGWPLLLAVAIRLGVPGEELWRVAGLFGAALACGVGGLAVWMVLRLTGAFSAALGAGLLAGAAWASAPLAAAAGSTCLGDEPAALVSGLSLILGGVAGLGQLGARPRALAAGGSGLCFGLVASMRPACALLLLPAALVVGLGAWPALGPRRALRLAALAAAGALVVPLLTGWLLVRSRLPAWQWSGYERWAPRWYTDLGTTFNLRYALRGNADFERGPGLTPIPNVVFYGKILLGVPGLDRLAYLGLFWPGAAWLAGAALAWHLRRTRPSAWLAARPAVGAGLLVVAGYLALYSVYFFPAARFVMLPMTLPPVLLAVAIGVAAAAPASRWRRWAAGLLALAWAGLMIAGLAPLRGGGEAEALPGRDIVARVQQWLSLPPAVRGRGVVPFDPVEAQALGLLPPSLVERLDGWGTLPETVEVRRLRALGLLR